MAFINLATFPRLLIVWNSFSGLFQFQTLRFIQFIPIWIVMELHFRGDNLNRTIIHMLIIQTIVSIKNDYQKYLI